MLSTLALLRYAIIVDSKTTYWNNFVETNSSIQKNLTSRQFFLVLQTLPHQKGAS